MSTPTPERIAEIRFAIDSNTPAHVDIIGAPYRRMARELLAALDAVTRERDKLYEFSCYTMNAIGESMATGNLAKLHEVVTRRWLEQLHDINPLLVRSAEEVEKIRADRAKPTPATEGWPEPLVGLTDADRKRGDEQRERLFGPGVSGFGPGEDPRA